MRTFMMTWNPRQGRPPDLGDAIRDISKGGTCKDAWSTGNRKDIPIGSRVFLLRQGVEPKGIVASGYTRSKPKQNDVVDDHSHYCKVMWTMAINAEDGEVLSLNRMCKVKSLAEVPWGIACGGREFSYEEATDLERLWGRLLASMDKTEVSLP